MSGVTGMSGSDTVDRTVYPPVGDTVSLPDNEDDIAEVSHEVSYEVSGLLCGDLSNDAWHRQALGKSAHSVWHYLHLHPGKTVTEVAAGIGKVRSTVYGALQKLADEGMAECVCKETKGDTGEKGRKQKDKERQEWFAAPADEVALGIIALRRSTWGRTDAKRQRHKQEQRDDAGRMLLDDIKRWKETRLEQTAETAQLEELEE
jgi:hypothetical protein